ncbi:PhnD/SsuA/transferrin family substrate-binding protein [Oligella ureolytica]
MTFWAGVLSAQSHFYAESNSASSETIKIAALSYLGADATRQEWQPTVNWLVNDLPQYEFEFIPAEHDDIIELVKSGSVDYVLTNPGLYSLLHYEYGINHMLSQVYANDNVSPLSLGSTLIKRKDNHEIQRFEDLSGHSMAVVSQETFGGYQVMLRELRSRHINPERICRYYKLIFL